MALLALSMDLPRGTGCESSGLGFVREPNSTFPSGVSF